MLAKGTADLELRLKAQEQRLRHMEYQHLGLLSVICQDNDAGQIVLDRGVREVGRRIDLMDKRVPIALSYDQMDLLLPAGLPLELPDIRDPQRNRASVDEPIPTMAQRYADRASGETAIAALRYMVFRPISTLVILKDNELVPWGNSVWPRVHCGPDREGRHMVLLFDPKSGRAHFVFGRFQFSTALGRPAPVQRLALATA